MLAPIVLCAPPVLLVLLWPFFYVPAPTSEHCWIVPPGVTTEVGVGLQSTLHLDYAAENDGNFVALYVWYVLAVTASAVGCGFSFRLLSRLLALGDYSVQQARYNSYVRVLCIYFGLQLLINFLTCVTFVENRCHFHNVDMSRYDDTKCSSEGGNHEHDCCASREWGEYATCRDGYTPFPAEPPASDCRYTCMPPPNMTATLPPVYSASAAGSYFVRILYLLGPLPGGVLTNMVLELVLVRKARMIEGVASCARFLTNVGRLIMAQLAFMLIFMCVYSWIVASVVVDTGAATGSPLDTDHDGVVSGEEEWSTQGQVALSLLGAVHTLISIALCAVFVFLLLTMVNKQRARAFPTSATASAESSGTAAVLAPAVGHAVAQAVAAPPSGSLDESTVLVVRRVAACTLLAVASTLLCYGNFVACAVNWYVMLAVDSIINDLALLYVAYTGEVDDVANAQDAQQAQETRERKLRALAQEQQHGIALAALGTSTRSASSGSSIGSAAKPIVTPLSQTVVALSASAAADHV